jgi:small subunit ribosomal protein S17
MAKTIIGIVSSSKADKTIVVTVATRKTHPLYRKQYSVSTKFMAHDEKNEAQVGDKVSIIETKPLSKRKRFTLETIIEKPALRETDRVDTHVESAPKPAKEEAAS